MFAKILFGEKWGRLVSVVAGCGCSFAAGTLFNFGAYSVDFSQRLGIESAELLGSLADFGFFLGLTMGIFLDKFGATPCICLSGVLAFIGYLFVWLQVSSLPLIEWTLYPLYFIIGQGSAGLFIGSLSATVKNLERRQTGKAIGLCCFFFGFSTVITTVVYLKIDLPHYLGSLAAMVAVFSFFGVMFVEDFAPEISEQPFLSPTWTLDDESDEEILMGGSDIFSNPNLIANKGATEAWRYAEMPFLFVSLALIGGAGLLYKNLIGTIAHSFEMEISGDYVIIFALCVTFSALCLGLLGDIVGHNAPQLLWPIMTSSLALIVYLTLIFCDKNLLLWFLSVTAGISSGSIFVFVYSLVVIYFGKEDMGIKVQILAVGPGFCGIFALWASGYAARLKSPEGILQCTKEDHCFEFAYILSSVMVLTGIFCLVALAIRQKKRTAEKREGKGEWKAHPEVGGGEGSSWGGSPVFGY